MINEYIKNFENNLINKYISSLLTKNDLKLLELIFKKNPTQEELDIFLKNYDIEVVGGYKALILSYFMRMHPHLNFTQYESPRLKGVFNFYRFRNVKLLSYFIKIGKILNEQNIPMLILKGFAMKYLRPELSRAMGDIDILVPEKSFLKAINLIKKMDYRLDIYAHSIDVHEPDSDAGILDIHRYIQMRTGKERLLNNFLFKRAKEANNNGIKVLVPCHEDLFFLNLVNLVINLTCKVSKASTLYVLFDCQYLLEKPDFNFDIVLDNIKLTRTQSEAAHAIKFINAVIPDLIPKELAEHKFLKNCAYKKCIGMVFNTVYFPALRKIAKKSRFSLVLNKQKKFSDYLRLRLLFKFCKFIKKYNLLLLMSCILRNREKKHGC